MSFMTFILSGQQVMKFSKCCWLSPSEASCCCEDPYSSLTSVFNKATETYLLIVKLRSCTLPQRIHDCVPFPTSYFNIIMCPAFVG